MALVNLLSRRPTARLSVHQVARIVSGMLNGPSVRSQTGGERAATPIGGERPPLLDADARMPRRAINSTFTAPDQVLAAFRRARRHRHRCPASRGQRVPAPSTLPSWPVSTTATICSFCSTALKLTRARCRPVLDDADALTQTRQVRPVSIHGGSMTAYSNSLRPAGRRASAPSRLAGAGPGGRRG